MRLRNNIEKKDFDFMSAQRGQFKPDASLASHCWFRAGGSADGLFHPADAADLADFLRACPRDVPVHVIGAGSNILVRDGGVRGIVIHPGKAFDKIAIDAPHIHAGAGVLCASLARAARDAGIAGFEFMRGIPGTVGGALRMNAGAYGSETADVFSGAVALDRDGARHSLTREDMGFAYRHVDASDEMIFIEGIFKGEADTPKAIDARMDAMTDTRRAAQPPGARTGGSTFKNPGGRDPKGPKAWELIDAAGCRELREGAAHVCETHCNFLVNTGGASASDIETLGETIRARVEEHSGVRLAWEIQRIGVPAQ